MAEPRARAARVERVRPWLQHWSIADERIGGYRSDGYALRSPDGLLLVDPVPLEEHLVGELEGAAGIFLTHGNHQRSAWRLRRELGATVFAPAGVSGLEEEPDVLVDGATKLPGGVRAIPASGFEAACYLSFVHADGTGVLFCGDLLVREPDGSFRFPEQPGYFDHAGGRADARALSALPMGVLCGAHVAPSVEDCGALLAELAAG